MYKIICLAIFTIAFAGTLPEEKIVDIEAHLKQVISAQVKKECETCVAEVYLHNKKLISDVAIPDMVIAEHWKGQTNLVLKLGEENRIVTATIRWKDKVVIAKKNIRQGKVIEITDLKAVEKDVTFLQTPYITKVDQAVGWEGRKIFRRGQIIDEGYLKKPLVVKFGQTVKVIFEQGSLSLSMTGKARGAGAIGDRIPVLIPNTKKNISGVVLEKGLVRVQ